METWNDRLNQALLDRGIKSTELASGVGVKKPTITAWRDGTAKNMTAENAAKISRFLKINLEWLITGKGSMTDSNVVSIRNQKTPDNYLEIPRFDVSASMGLGNMQPEGHAEVIDRMTVNKDWLRRNINPSTFENLAVITGLGDSMEGTFNDGDLLLVDRGVTDVKLDAVYVLALNDELYIKRLQRRPDGTLLMLSDNPKYAPYQIQNGDLGMFEVLGRVLMAWNAKRL